LIDIKENFVRFTKMAMLCWIN